MEFNKNNDRHKKHKVSKEILCPLCQTQTFLDVNIKTLGVFYHKCPSCNLLFVPIGEKWYLDYKSYNYPDEKTAQLEAESLLNRFEHVIKQFRPELFEKSVSVLDIGCGNGLFLANLTKKYPNKVECLGLDPSEQSQKNASKNGIECIQAMFGEHDFGKNSFDAVTIFGNLMLHENPFETLKKAMDLLKPGGVLLFDVKNGNCSFRKITRTLFKITPSLISDNIIRAAFHGMRYQFNKKALKMFLPKIGKIILMKTFPPRAMITSSKTTYSKGLKKAFVRIFDLIDIILSQQAWIEVAVSKEEDH